MKETVTMLFIHARSLTADDMPFVGNNIASAVRRERRRSHAHDPIGINSPSAGRLADHTDGPAKLVLLAPPSMPAA
jgi:hypothetical protein